MSKRAVTYNVTFNPGAMTIDMTAVSGFDIRKLFAILNLSTVPTGVVYAAGTPGFGYSLLSGNVLTLQAPMAGMTANDKLLILYDDGDQASAAAFVQMAVAGAAISNTNRLPVEVDANNAGIALDTSVQSSNALLGSVGSTPPSLPGASTGIIGYLRLLYTTMIGGPPVTLPGGTAPSASFTRPANNTAYSSGQLVANSVSAGSVTPMSFTVARANGVSVRIKRVRVAKSSNVLTGASYRLHLYTAAPTIANGDGGAWQTTGAASSYLGSFDVVMLKAFTDGAQDVGVPTIGAEMLVVPGSGQTTIFGLLEARGSYANAAGAETYTVALECERD